MLIFIKINVVQDRMVHYAKNVIKDGIKYLNIQIALSVLEI